MTSKSTSKNKKIDEPKKKLLIGIVAVVLVAVVVALIVLGRKSMPKFTSVTAIESIREFKDKLNIDVKEPVDAKGLAYGIENDNVARVSYTKKVSDNAEMSFILRTSSSTEDIEKSIGLDVEFAYTPIMMTVVCDDGSEITVESKVAVDSNTEEMKYMKALWFDNDKYYSMVTDNLVTREDFLQEVNRVIIANHIPF